MTIVLIIIVVLIVLVLLYGVLQYNGLIRLRNVVQESWRQIDVELKRRHDLIPNLVETVKGYAAHERETLEAVISARTAAVAPGSSVAQQAQQENVLTQALGRLFAVAEAYPNLKANESFLALQAELTGTEDRIAAGRRFYNANVRALNTKVETVPVEHRREHVPRAEGRLLPGRRPGRPRGARRCPSGRRPPPRRRRPPRRSRRPRPRRRRPTPLPRRPHPRRSLITMWDGCLTS